MRVAVHNLGCKVNGYELDVMVQALRAQGWEIVPFEEKADVYVINTCTVTNIADRKSRQMLHKAKHENPAAIVVAVGCYVETDEARVAADPCVDLAVGNNRKGKIAEILTEYLRQHPDRTSNGKHTDTAGGAIMDHADGLDAAGIPDHVGDEGHKDGESRDKDGESYGADDTVRLESAKTLQGRTMEDLTHAPEFESMKLTTPGHTRAYIKIQDGCNQFCTYCIIPYARGRIRSRDTDEIVEEVKGLAAEGVQEVVLTGIHISSFGKDRGEEPEEALLDLLTRIQLIAGIRRIRLGSLEPRIMTENFVRHIAALSKVCPHFHLSLQSGCDATLKRMNRHYTAEEYDQGVELLRQYYDRPAITTDVIVGFAGETPEEFAESKAFLEKVNFYEIHVFKYSVRHGTVAAGMPCQQSPQTKAERSDILLALTAEQAHAYRESFLGQQEEILLEEPVTIGGRTWWTGHTMRYVQGAVPADVLQDRMPEPPQGSYEGLLIKGRFTRFLEDEHFLEMEI